MTTLASSAPDGAVSGPVEENDIAKFSVKSAERSVAR
jgi:hypothetical protein